MMLMVSLEHTFRFVTATSITILAVDKCQSICAKHNYRITNVFSMALLTKLIWLISIILCLPIILYSSMISVSSNAQFGPPQWSSTVCRLNLFSPNSSKDNITRSSLVSLIHPLVLVLYFCILYLVPLMITIISHGKTYLHLLQHSHRYSHVHDLQKR